MLLLFLYIHCGLFNRLMLILLFDSIAAISCRMYVNSPSFDIWTPVSVPREYIYMFVSWLKFLLRRYIFWSTFVFFCSLSLMKFSVIEILCTSRLRMDSLRVFWSFLWSSQILFYGFLLRGRNTEDFIGKVLIIICTLSQSGREVIESHERYEGKFCDCVLCPPDLCHAGCARLAGQKMSNKKKFFVSEGRWHGEFARLSLLACVSFSLFPFAFIYLHRSTTYKSVTIALLVRIPCLGPWMGFFSIRRTMLNPLGSARRKISDWAYSSPDLQGYVRFFNTPTRDWGTRIILILFQAWSLIFNFQVQNMERPYRFSYNNCSFLMFIPYWSQLTIGYIIHHFQD